MRLRVATQKRDMETLANQLEQAMRLDSRTGLLRRAAFIETAKARVTEACQMANAAVSEAKQQRALRDKGDSEADVLRLLSDELTWGRSLFRVLGELPIAFEVAS